MTLKQRSDESADRLEHDARRRANRVGVSAVLVVEDGPDCDGEGAQLLIRFAAPSLRALSRRRTLGQVRDVLLWCTFAWNHAKGETAAEELATIERDFGLDAREEIEDLFRLRLTEYAAIDKEIGPLCLTRLPSGAVAVHVDARPLPEHQGGN